MGSGVRVAENVEQPGGLARYGQLKKQDGLGKNKLSIEAECGEAARGRESRAEEEQAITLDGCPDGDRFN